MHTYIHTKAHLLQRPPTAQAKSESEVPSQDGAGRAGWKSVDVGEGLGGFEETAGQHDSIWAAVVRRTRKRKHVVVASSRDFSVK